MAINDRIKEVRMASGLSQIDFAKSIGISSSGMSKLEKGDNNPADRTLKLICQEFGISRIWLETGEGDMIDPQVETDIQLLTRAMEGQSEAKKTILRAVALMPDDLLELFLQKLQQAQKKEP